MKKAKAEMKYGKYRKYLRKLANIGMAAKGGRSAGGMAYQQ